MFRVGTGKPLDARDLPPPDWPTPHSKASDLALTMLRFTIVQPHLMYKSALSTGGLRSTCDTCIRHSGVVQGRNSESWGF